MSGNTHVIIFFSSSNSLYFSKILKASFFLVLIKLFILISYFLSKSKENPKLIALEEIFDITSSSFDNT